MGKKHWTIKKEFLCRNNVNVQGNFVSKETFHRKLLSLNTPTIKMKSIIYNNYDIGLIGGNEEPHIWRARV